jgi:hypothetical protein
MRRVFAAILGAALVVSGAVLPACRQQAGGREDVQRIPAVPPPPQTIPPNMPPPPVDQRVPAQAPRPADPAPAQPTTPPPAALPPGTGETGGAGGLGGAPAPAHAELPVLVNYTRTGGIVGMNQALTVYDNGRLEVATWRGQEQLNRIEHQVDPAELLALRRIVEDGEFRALGGPYVNTRGADLMTHTLRVNTSQGPKQVEATDGIDWPPPLRAAIEELNRLLTLAAAGR